jgi:hypothetical protein
MKLKKKSILKKELKQKIEIKIIRFKFKIKTK